MNKPSDGFTGFRQSRPGETLTRFVKLKGEARVVGKPRQKTLPLLGHPTVEASRSLFYRKGVRDATTESKPLVSGYNNVKIGRDVRKGHLRGYWLFTLSLEERATCPRSCHHWYDCFGNNMPWARRWRHGPDLLVAIEHHIKELLAVRGRRGILVRLHALGDFYSAAYVGFWHRMLLAYPGLSVYGYTAHAPGSTIGNRVKLLGHLFGDRWRVRFSNSGEPRNSTVPIVKEEDCPPGAFVCPEQTGRTLCCATCALCWATDKPVAFLAH